MKHAVTNKEANWINQSFMVPNGRLATVDARQRLFSNAAVKYTDSSLGGNWAINAPPQFTENADIDSRADFIIAGLTKTEGMGRRYSDSIDDYSQLLYIRAGVPEYNSLVRFFTSFYNVKASVVTRLGRMDGAAYTAGQAVGYVVSLPIQVLFTLNDMMRWLTKSPASKFYYLKPTMGLYWNAVTSIVNHLGVNMGMVDPSYSPEVNDQLDDDEKMEPANTDQRAALVAMAPEIYYPDGSLDVYAVANRASRRAFTRKAEIEALFEKAGDDAAILSGINEQFRKDLQSSVKHLYLNGSFVDGNKPDIVSLHHRLLDWFKLPSGGAPTEGTTEEITKSGTPEAEGWFSKLGQYVQSELADGAAFATFRVNQPRGVGDSFSNTSSENQLASEINSFSNTARQARISLADGNFVGGLAGEVGGAVLGTAASFVGGAIDSIGLGGAKSVFGNAFVDIPKNWESSSTNTAPMNFSLTLKAAYGNKQCIYQQILFPMAMLLALVAPRSTGRHSYTGPFLVEAYCQGIAQTRLGLVSSMNFTRGSGNVGFTLDRLPLQVDVSFTIEELSTVMHMPIAPAFSFDPTEGLFSEDSLYSDYLNTLSALGLSDQIYIRKRWGLNLKRKLAGWRTQTSPARWASWFNGTDPGRIMNAIAREIDR